MLYNGDDQESSKVWFSVAFVELTQYHFSSRCICRSIE